MNSQKKTRTIVRSIAAAVVAALMLPLGVGVAQAAPAQDPTAAEAAAAEATPSLDDYGADSIQIVPDPVTNGANKIKVQILRPHTSRGMYVESIGIIVMDPANHDRIVCITNQYQGRGVRDLDMDAYLPCTLPRLTDTDSLVAKAFAQIGEDPTHTTMFIHPYTTDIPYSVK